MGAVADLRTERIFFAAADSTPEGRGRVRAALLEVMPTRVSVASGDQVDGGVLHRRGVKAGAGGGTFSRLCIRSRRRPAKTKLSDTCTAPVPSAPKRAAPPTTGRFHFHRARSILAGLQGGDEPPSAAWWRGQNAGAEREHAPIRFRGQVSARRARGEEQHQWHQYATKRPPGGSNRETRAFGESCFPQAHATGADGEAHAHFVASRERAHQQ